MSDLETSVARLRELQVEAETALDVARKAFAQVERAVAKIDNQIESLERSGVKRERGAFASPLQGMAYIAIWLACEGKADHSGVRADEFYPYLEKLRRVDGTEPNFEKLAESLEGGLGHHLTISRGLHKLLPDGLRAVQLHWARVTGIPDGRSPPAL